MVLKDPCAEFFYKWMKDGNFCGLSKEEAKLVNQYIPLIQEIVKTSNLPERTVFKNLNPHMVKPLLLLKKDNPNREKGISYIINSLTKNEGPTRKTIESAIGIEPLPKKLVDPNAKRVEIPKQIVYAEKSADASHMNKWFLSGLNTGQKLQWKNCADKIDLDNEYLAFCYITSMLDKIIKE
jgi:hypothetical protein